MVFCACSMKNAPGASEMPQDEHFRTKEKILPSKRVLGAWAGCGDVTSLSKNLVPVKIRKTNFLRQAIKEPIFC
jgi:hypothetical protein